MVLRSYQFKAVQKGVEFFQESSIKEALEILPTGAGKSLIISELANQLKEGVISCQPSIELLKQNFEKFTKTGNEASIYSASFGKKEHSNVTFATIGSIAKKGEEFRKKGYKYLILDEAHLFSRDKGGMYREFMKAAKIKKVLGLTATGFKLNTMSDYSQLEMLTKKGRNRAMFQDIIYLQQIQDIIKEGFWSKLEYESFDGETGELIYNSTGAEYTDESIQKFYISQDIERKIINRVIDSDAKSILIFVPTIQQAQILSAKIPNSMCVFSGMDKKLRQKAVNDFKNGIIRTAINVNILSVGFNHEEIDHVIDAVPTASLAKYYQKIGRGCRIHPLKEKCIITDFAGNVNKFGLVENIKYRKNGLEDWNVYSEDRLLTGIPIHLIRPWKIDGEWNVYVNFGKYLGKKVSDLSDRILIDMFKNTKWDSSNMHIREEILNIKKQRTK